MVSKEEEEKYLQMIKGTKEMLAAEKTTSTPEVGCQRIRLGDEKKKIKGHQLTQDIDPDWIKDWKGHNTIPNNINTNNNTAVDKVTVRTSNGDRILIKKWNRPSENEREEIHNVDNRPERVPRDAKDERTVTFGPTTRLKIQVEKDTIEEREEKRNS